MEFSALVTDEITNQQIKVVVPKNLGWLEKKLTSIEMDHLWRCIKNHKESYKQHLAGNISNSYLLDDERDWFFTNTLLPLCENYSDAFRNLGDNLPLNQRHPYHLRQFWVNYQKQNEFNPTHCHSGIYSFVIWMKIPTKHQEQNKNPIASFSNSPKISCFDFNYVNILGELDNFTYRMDPEMEGTLVFFPAKLQHCVYPFYNSNQERISISGNIGLDTTRVVR